MVSGTVFESGAWYYCHRQSPAICLYAILGFASNKENSLGAQKTQPAKTWRQANVVVFREWKEFLYFGTQRPDPKRSKQPIEGSVFVSREVGNP